MTDTRYAAVVALLESWAEWHHTDTDIDIGYPSRSAGFQPTGLTSFEDMCDRADQQAMRAVDAAVGSLPPAQAAAVYCMYGISNVFRFPRNNLESLFDEALMRLSVVLRSKGFIC